MTNAVKKKEETNIVTFDTSVFEEDAGKGLTNLGSEDLSIPFLRILSDTNDEVKKRSPKYIEGAEVGMMFNTLTRELYSGEEGVQVIPCAYQPQLIEWSDRGKGTGAPVNIHPVSSNILSKTTRDDNNKDRLPNGNYIENTANHFVIMLGSNPTSALISMKATQLKVSRKWNSMMMGIKLQGKNGLFTPPTYSHIYKLKTVQMSNDKGTWFGWDVSQVGPIQDKGVYEIAKNFAEKVGTGEIEAKPETQEPKKTINL